MVKPFLFCAIPVRNGIPNGQSLHLCDFSEEPRGSASSLSWRSISLTFGHLKQTPSASFASFSPTAFHSSPLNSSKPSLYSNHPFPTPSPVNSFRSTPSSGSPYELRTPERLPIELTNRPGPLVPQKAYNAPFLGGKRPMQIGFQFVGGAPGIPMRLLQDASALDLPIEDANSIPFPQSVASTITLRIWVSIRFAPLAVLLSYAESCVSGRVMYSTLDE